MFFVSAIVTTVLTLNARKLTITPAREGQPYLPERKLTEYIVSELVFITDL